MSNRSLFCIVLVSLYSFVPTSVAETRSNESIVEDYIKALGVLESKYEHCSGVGIFSNIQIRRDKSESSKRSEVEFAFSGQSRRVIQTWSAGPESPAPPQKAEKPGSPPAPFRRVTSYNNKYSFILSQAKPDSNYVVQSLETTQNRIRRSLPGGLSDAVRCATKPSLYTFAELSGSPGFRVDRVTEIRSSSGPSRTRIDFSITGDFSGHGSGAHCSSGWLVVCPDEGWILHDYGIVMTGNTKTTSHTTRIGHVDYERGPGGEPQPAKCGYRWYRGRFDAAPTSPDVIPVAIEEFQFTKWRFDDPPAREFTLAAFGLPEFAEPAAQRLNRPFPWWIVGAAAGCAVLAEALRRLAKRPRTPKTEIVA